MDYKPPTLRDRFLGRLIEPAQRAMAERVDAALVEPSQRVAERIAVRFDSIVSALTGLGTANDKGSNARPDTSRAELTAAEVTALYTHNGYVRRFVDEFADELTAKGWHVVEGVNPIDLADVESALDVQGAIFEGQRLGALYGSALVVIVTDEEDPAMLAEPLNVEAIGEVKALVPLERAEFSVAEYDGTFDSGRYREALAYQLHPISASGATGALDGAVVHWSRCLYFYGARRTPAARFLCGGYDLSLVDVLWDQIRNLTTGEQSGAILATEAKQDVLKVAGLSQVDSGKQAELFRMRLEAMAMQKSALNMVIVGDDESFESRAAPTAGFGELRELHESAMSAVAVMPRTILFGDTPSGLNSDGEASRRAYDRTIGKAQRRRLQRPLTWLYEVLLAAAGKRGQAFAVTFNPLGELTETEQAAVRKTTAEVDKIYIELGVYAPDDVARSRYGSRGWQADLLPVVEDDDDLGEGEGEDEVEIPEPDPQALNGAQVVALLDVLRAFNAGEVERDAAVLVLVSAFGMTPEVADEMVPAEPLEGPEPEPAPAPAAAPAVPEPEAPEPDPKA